MLALHSSLCSLPLRDSRTHDITSTQVDATRPHYANVVSSGAAWIFTVPGYLYALVGMGRSNEWKTDSYLNETITLVKQVPAQGAKAAPDLV
jgi:hypothetical protein